MISFLKGQLTEWDGETATLDVNGVGYEIHLAQNSDLVSSVGSSASVWIHTHVREDQITLFGFSARNQKKMFLSLLKVNGVGPKLALKVLSGSSLESLISMIEYGDVAGLSKIPKVGKKTAEQIVLTLKGKLDDMNVATFQAVGSSHKNQIKFALVNLGFKPSDVERVIQDFPETMDLQEGIRKGLADLSQIE